MPASPRGARGAGIDVVHLDMDAFFAAVEVLDHPELSGRPVIVGGTGPRGVVASASYEARRRGIHAAMPTAIARRHCPEGVFVAGRFARYRELSDRLRVLLEEVTPIVEPVALDEAYLDVSGAHSHFGSTREIAALLRMRVGRELGLSCSVGVGRTKLLAKLASKAAKPRIVDDEVVPGAGVVVIEPAHEASFLAAQPVRALPGIGPKSAARLARLGVQDVADLVLVPRETLVHLFGAAHGGLVYELAHGRDARPVTLERALRSIGHEETFEHDERAVGLLQRRVRELSLSLAQRCRASGRAGRTVVVKLRYADFTTRSRSRTVDQPLTSAAEIGEVAAQLLERFDLDQGVRLLGLQVSGLVPIEEARTCQLELFGEQGASVALRPHVEDLERAADEIRRRYGGDALSSLAELQRHGTGQAEEARRGDA